MPGFDGTGPRGMGPMTGGGRGYCAVAFTDAANRPFLRRGFYGRGGGRGFRNYSGAGYPVWRISREDEIAMLKEEADFLKQQLEDIETRLHAMEAPQETD